MRLPLVSLFGDDGKEVKVGSRDHMTGFLVRLADRALERRFADGGFEFAADRTPRPEIRCLRPQEQQVLTGGIFEKNEDRDFVGEGRSRHQRWAGGGGAGNQV